MVSKYKDKLKEQTVPYLEYDNMSFEGLVHDGGFDKIQAKYSTQECDEAKTERRYLEIALLLAYPIYHKQDRTREIRMSTPVASQAEELDLGRHQIFLKQRETQSCFRQKIVHAADLILCKPIT